MALAKDMPVLYVGDMWVASAPTVISSYEGAPLLSHAHAGQENVIDEQTFSVALALVADQKVLLTVRWSSRVVEKQGFLKLNVGEMTSRPTFWSA